MHLKVGLMKIIEKQQTEAKPERNL